jgi:16S rRNA (uracil1498-N3)-methyltransferase
MRLALLTSGLGVRALTRHDWVTARRPDWEMETYRVFHERSNRYPDHGQGFRVRLIQIRPLRHTMSIPRILVDLPLEKAGQIILPARPSRHLVQVLRLRAGNPLILFNGDGRDFPGRLVIPTKDAVVVELDEATEEEPAPKLQIHLGIGVSKGERMDWVIQKAVELGVTRITPLFTKRTVSRLSGERLQKRRKHWRGILEAACEQSGRRRVPNLGDNGSLAEWITQRHPFPLLLDHGGDAVLAELPAPAGAMTLLVGPEGGLDPEERTSSMRAGFTAVRLGPRILRTETAPLAAIAAVQMLWGDFRE